MNLTISDKKGVPIQKGMTGLFFEDINYGADGGLYAEMLENRSFEFFDCYGDKGDYYVKQDCGYGWRSTDESACRMEYVMGSPVDSANPHYLRFTSTEPGRGFQNKAYRGIYLEKGKKYRVSFYARMVSYEGQLQVMIKKGEQVYASGCVSCIHEPEDTLKKWIRYEISLAAEESVKGGEFTILLEKEGVVEFDLVSMMPEDAVAGIFRKDLFEALKELNPGFLRFPGGCVVEGNTLENRYQWKKSVGRIESRKANYNRWSLHGTSGENGWHTKYSHYNQTLGIGFYEYFLLCELIGAKPLPVLNVGLACQYQSYELVKIDSEEFKEFVQDALDLIEFANGADTTYWGGLRARMGHREPFGLEMIGIGNEQWQTAEVDFFERYQAFEKAVHEVCPDIRLIGSAGPDITSEHYCEAWDFYRRKGAENPDFAYAVDEHYYVKPEWFYEHTDFYDSYPRDIKVFAGEYAAHPENGMNRPDANTLAGALSEAAFLTGIERNADVVVLASYAPLLARLSYAQWSPDMIWFDEEAIYLTPSYYVQKLYSEHAGTVTVPMDGQEKEFRKEKIYINVVLDEAAGEYIIKAVNADNKDREFALLDSTGEAVCQNAGIWLLCRGDMPECGCRRERPENAVFRHWKEKLEGKVLLPSESFCVLRIPAQK